MCKGRINHNCSTIGSNQMNTRREREDYFKSFQKGEIDVYMIVKKDADLDDPRRGDILLRKLDEKKVTVTGWRRKADAEAFLLNSVGSDEYIVDAISGAAFRKFLNKFDDSARKSLFLDVV